MTQATQASTAPPTDRSAGTSAASTRPSKSESGLVRLWRTSWRALAFMAIVVLVWWLVTARGWVQPYILPSPGETFGNMVEYAPYFLQHTWITTYETVLGFLIAVVLGELVAILMVGSRNLQATIYPIILVAQVIPKIAIAPLFVVWLGFGMGPKITVAVLMAFFPIVISGLAGLKSVDPEILDLAKTMGAGKLKTFAKIQFPASLPQLLSGTKVAATLAVTGAVVGEFVGGNEGLGYVILRANGNMDTATLFAALIIMSAIGILLFAVIQLAENLLIPWHASRRTDDSSPVVPQA